MGIPFMGPSPRPFFAAADELSTLTSEDGALASFLMPTIKVTPERLERAINEVEALAGWIDQNLDRAAWWRTKDNC
jgi:uroporphyrinogen-III synthase